MKSMHDKLNDGSAPDARMPGDRLQSPGLQNLHLRSMYRAATRGLPVSADGRLTVDEVLALAAGRTLGARHSDALRGIAESSDQAVLLRLLTESHALSTALADELHVLRKPELIDRLRTWWRSAALPPVFASAGIALMAVIGFQFLNSPALTLPQTALAPVTAPVEAPMFGGAFEPSDQMFAASLEPSEQPDRVFGGDFDS